MPPSSTSSSEPLTRPRQWGRFALVVVLLLSGVEIALRFPAVRALLPPRTHYYHPAITTRLDAVERMLSEHNRVDVLFVGSSIVLTNVHPQIFDTIASKPRGGVSFNAGLPGLWPVSVQLYTEHLWLPAVRPRLVVQGIRYPELAARTHAKHESQVWSGTIEPSWRDADPMTHLYATLVSNVYLLQYRGAGVRMLRRYRNGWVDPNAPDAENPYETRGHQALMDSDTPVEDWEADLPNDGICENGSCDVGFAALRHTIAAVRAAGSEYVLLNVPEHGSRWRGAEGVRRYQHYLEQLAAFAAAERVDLIDPTGGDPFRFDGTPYADLAHMTDAGSRQFTRAVAQQMAPLVAGGRADPPPAAIGLDLRQDSTP